MRCPARFCAINVVTKFFKFNPWRGRNMFPLELFTQQVLLLDYEREIYFHRLFTPHAIILKF